jgi:EpsI family protein
MSRTEPTTVAANPTPTPRRRRAWAWVRVALACALLLGSAAVQSAQDRRTHVEMEAARVQARFDLNTVPMTMGPWKGQDTQLDPLIARGTGADQIVTRRYVNSNTGSALDVILLYGPAVEMYIHIPEVCYPAAGYTQAGDAKVRDVTAGPHQAPFRAMVYAKGEGPHADLQEVYYSWWRYGRGWSPDPGTQKEFERIPSMYKVQLARRVSDRERRDVGNPCESLLQELLPQMERRIATSQSAAQAQTQARADLTPPPGKGK